LGGLLVPGEHNRVNADVARTVCELFGAAPEVCSASLRTWEGIPHRLEKCCTVELKPGTTVGVYNDTAATVPEATVAALEAFGEAPFGENPLHLIAGGTDKGADPGVLASALNKKPPASVHLLSGTATDRLIPLLGIPFAGPFDSLESLLRDVRGGLENGEARKNGPGSTRTHILLFSPGATSFGMFKNEFDRGEQFKGLVRDLFPGGR
jgi:UDP-N-acetylmuramoylalanine--D-glutamate ligase